MKLHIREWQHVVTGLHLAEATERHGRELALKANDPASARRSYVAAEQYQAVREKIEQEKLG
jgi:hypothetical protein